MTLNLELSLAYDPNNYGPGSQQLTATLSTGTCVSQTSCTATTPLSGSSAPEQWHVHHDLRCTVAGELQQQPYSHTVVPEGYTVESRT